MKGLVLNFPKIELRPLPECIVVVAFPDAYKQSTLVPAAGQEDFFIIQAPVKEIEIDTTGTQWLKLLTPKAIGSAISQVNYRAKDNAGPNRKLYTALRVRNKSYQIEFMQQGGALVQKEMVRVLNSPLNIDFLVAITYIASLIKKIEPPPIKIIVTIIAAVAIIALSLAISAARHAFDNVPEPKPLSTDTNGVPITIFPGLSLPQGLPLEFVATEDQLIALQTVKELYWLLKQVE